VKRDPRVVMTAVLAAAWFTLPLGVSILLFAHLGEVSDWLRGHGSMGAFVGAGAFAVAAGIGLLPTYAQAVLMGWVFGFVTGTGVSVAGYVGGALIGWSFSRLVAGDSVRALIDRQPRWGVVRAALVEASAPRTAFLVALLRFPPNSPFAFTNLVLAATGVRFLPMIAGSIAGMLPRTAVACWVGAQAASTGAKDLAELMKKQGPMAIVIGVVLLVAALAVMQHIGKRALRAAGIG
jgi:uncharacterized membrane protein YdjX (TVP38/TMEM64 family)